MPDLPPLLHLIPEAIGWILLAFWFVGLLVTSWRFLRDRHYGDVLTVGDFILSVLVLWPVLIWPIGKTHA